MPEENVQLSLTSDYELRMGNATDYLAAANQDLGSAISILSGIEDTISSYKSELEAIGESDLKTAFGTLDSDVIKLKNSVNGTDSENGILGDLGAAATNYSFVLDTVFTMIDAVEKLQGDERNRALELMNEGKTISELFMDEALKRDLVTFVSDVTMNPIDKFNSKSSEEVYKSIFKMLWHGKEGLLKDVYKGTGADITGELASLVFGGGLADGKEWAKVGVKTVKSSINNSVKALADKGKELAKADVADSTFTSEIAKRLAKHPVAVKCVTLGVSFAANVAISVLVNKKDITDVGVWVDAGAKVAIGEVSKLIVGATLGKAFAAGSATGSIVTGVATAAVSALAMFGYDKLKDWYYSNEDGISSQYEHFTNEELSKALLNSGYDFGVPTIMDAHSSGDARLSVYDVAVQMQHDGLPEDFVEYFLANAGIPTNNESEFYTIDEDGNVWPTPKGLAIQNVMMCVPNSNEPEIFDTSNMDEESAAFYEEYNAIVMPYYEQIRDTFYSNGLGTNDCYWSVGQSAADNSKLGAH